MKASQSLCLSVLLILQASVGLVQAQIPPVVVVNEGQDVVLNAPRVPVTQWQFEDADIPGATNATLRLAAVTVREAGYYSVLAFGGSWHAAVLVVQTAAPHPGSTDTSFQPDYRGDTVYSLALQPDGKVLVAGYSGLRRLLANGTSDPGFNPPLPDVPTRRVLLQRDGRILVERSTLNGSTVLRLLADGAVDPEFHPPASVTLLAVQNDDRILALTGPVQLARLKTDGSLDASFQSPDLLKDGFGVNAGLSQVFVQPDDRILISGLFDTVNGERRLLVARLLPNGALDRSFQADSFAGSPFLSAEGGLQIGGTLRDGRIVLLTPRNSPNPSQLLRLNADGSMDTSLTWSGQRYDWLTAAVQPDDKIVLVHNGTLFRFDAAGNLDPSFRAVLMPVLSVPGDSYTMPLVFAMAIQNDGRVLLGGVFDKINQDARTNLARLFSETADTPPIILQQPEARVVLDGDVATFQVRSTSFDSPAYQWRRDGVDLPNATNAVLLLASAQTTDSGPYDVILRNRAGATNSVPALLTVLSDEAAGFLRQPQDQVVAEGGRILLEIAVLSRAPLSYQWQFEGRDLPSATDSSYLISPALPENSGLYQAVVLGSLGAITSAVARVTITPGAPAPGTVDLALFPAEGANGVVESVSTLPDGRVLIAGGFTQVGRAPRHLVARLLPDGHVDDSFAGPDPGAVPDWAKVLLVLPLPDGSVLLRVRSKTLVSCGGPCAYTPIFAAKLREDGRVEGAFPPTGEFVDAMLVAPNGTVLIANDGPVLRGRPQEGALARFTPEGAADPEFPTLSISGGNIAGMLYAAKLQALAVQPTGKIVLMGQFADKNGRLATSLRLTSEGVVDPTFQLSIDPYRPNVAIAQPGNLLVQSDGKLLLTAILADTNRHVIRVTEDGALDPTFDASLSVEGGSGAIDGLYLQPDGRIIIWGDFTSIAGISRLKLARLEKDGRLDTSFAPLHQMDGSIASVATVDGGGLALGGTFSQVNGVRRANVAFLVQRQLVGPSLEDGHFTARIGTVQGRFYILESTHDLRQPQWAPSAAVSGDGSVKSMTDTNAFSTQTFYRLRVK